MFLNFVTLALDNCYYDTECMYHEIIHNMGKYREQGLFYRLFVQSIFLNFVEGKFVQLIR